jgi:hypothetical protein
LDDRQELIYRQAWYGKRPKSVALRRESDYHTGLSFSAMSPADGPYFVYNVRVLEEAGYTVEFNGGERIVSKWGTDWAIRDPDGQIKTYGDDHVSVYHERAFWQQWYQAELAAGGDGSSHFSQRFFELASDYREG